MEGDRPPEAGAAAGRSPSSEESGDDQGGRPQQHEEPGGMSTLFIAGFPADATTRELKNLCRMFPGYEGCNVNCKGRGSGSLFVKFQTVRDASEAMRVIDGMPFDDEHLDDFLLKVSFARRELDVQIEPIVFSERYAVPFGAAPTLRMVKEVAAARPNGGGGRVLAVHAHHGEAPRVTKRPRDDFVCDERRTRFRSGGDDRIDHGRGYGNDYSHGRGMQQGRVHDQARDPGRHAGDGHARQYARNPDPGHGYENGQVRHGRDRDEHRGGGGPGRGGYNRGSDHGRYETDPYDAQGGIDTVAVLNMRDKGYSDHDIRRWSSKEPGFLTMHYNQKIDGFFIKFASTADAGYAKEALNRRNVDAEMARRNLELRE